MRIPHYYLAGTRNSPVPCLHDSGCCIARGGVFDAYIHSPSSVTSSSCSSSSCHTLTWRYLLLHYHTATLLFPSSCFLTSIAIVDDNLLPRKDNPYILFSWSPSSIFAPATPPSIHSFIEHIRSFNHRSTFFFSQEQHWGLTPWFTLISRSTTLFWRAGLQDRRRRRQ